MKRHEFEHAVRAAGSILGVDAVLVIGSRAIHASLDDIFPEAAQSIEVEIASLSGNAEKMQILLTALLNWIAKCSGRDWHESMISMQI